MQRRITYRLRGLGDVFTDLRQYTSDQLLSAYNWLHTSAAQADQERVSMTQWLAANGQTLTADGKVQAIAALQSKTTAVNQLYDSLSKYQAVLNTLGVQTGMGGYSRRTLGALGLAVAIGVIFAILVAAGIAIYAIKAIDDAANAKFAQAQNMRLTIQAAADCLAKGTCTPQQAANIINAGAAGTNPPPKPESFPWNTLFISLGVAGVAYAVFG